MIANLQVIDSDGTTKEVRKKICEYKGATYTVERDRKLKKNYITYNGDILYLDKNGNVAAKQPGKFSTVDFLTVDEIADMKCVFKSRIEVANTPTNKAVAWRNITLFCCGINVGLRASDLRMLRWCDLFDSSNNRIWKYIFNAKKTGKRTEIAYNEAFFEAVELYMENLIKLGKKPDRQDFLFFSKKDATQPLSEQTMWQIINDAGIEANVKKNLGSHTLRKTFGRNIYIQAADKKEVLIMLQEWFKHSSPMTTLRYIGITFDDMFTLANSISL